MFHSCGKLNMECYLVLPLHRIRRKKNVPQSEKYKCEILMKNDCKNKKKYDRNVDVDDYND